MTSMHEQGLSHLFIEPQLVAFRRFNLKEREEILPAIQALAVDIPAGLVNGVPYCILQYFSSYPEGYEVEVGFPVTQAFEHERIQCKTSPALEVLAIRHAGPPETLQETKSKLRAFTSEHCLISDEFLREEYPEWQDAQGDIEAQFVIHNWNARLDRSLARVVGDEVRDQIMQGADEIGLETSPELRFEWTRSAMERLEALADDFQRYDVVSACAHVYPPAQLEKLHQVYTKARSQSADPMQAVDAVLAFMAADPGWGEKGMHREGRRIFHKKGPMDAEAYARAKADAEKRAAYCFCPVIRTRLAQGMPLTYCYCGSGWYRQQWEAATGKPVRVEVAGSVLKGDEACSFVVHLADDI
jgi:hypothetical protein